jgi:hypothetical protein
LGTHARNWVWADGSNWMQGNSGIEFTAGTLQSHEMIAIWNFFRMIFLKKPCSESQRSNWH